MHTRRRSILAAALTAAPALLCIAAGCDDSITAPEVEGVWGGLHISIELTADGGSVEYDCAHGSIDAGWTVTSGGALRGTGEHVLENGGPVREDEEVIRRPASYAGVVRGDRMTLTVTLTDSAQVVGTFDLQRGEAGRVFRCL